MRVGSDDLGWPLTRVSRSLYTYKWNISKWCVLGTKILEKPYQSTERFHFQWPWVTSDPYFKVTIFFDIEYLINDMRYNRNYYITSIGSHICANGDIFNDLYWPLTRCLRSRNFWSWISQKQCVLCTKLLLHISSTLYPTYRMVPCLVTRWVSK